MALDFGAIASGVGAIGGAISSLFGGGGSSKAADKAAEALWWAQRESAKDFARAEQALLESQDWARKDYYHYLNPYSETGGRGLTALGNVLAPTGGMTPVDMISGLPPGVGADVTNWLTKTPMYQFPLQEGQKAIERSAAARGMTLSPATLKALQNYSQNYALSNALSPAQTNYQNYLNNLKGLTNVGLTSSNALASGLSGITTNFGNQMAAANMDLARIQSGTAGGIASAYTNQAGIDAGQNVLGQRNLASAIGAIGGGIGGLINVFGGGGGGGTVPFNQYGANALNLYNTIWG